MRLSDRALNVSPSATLAISRKASQLKAQGVDVVGFGAGEPDFDTPKHIKDAAAQALAAGDTKYAPKTLAKVQGAVAEDVTRRIGVEYKPSQVLVSCGAKHSLYNAFQAITNPGDEVIILSPYWVTYPEQVCMAGGKPVFVETRGEDDFAPDIAKVRAALTPSTRAIVINSPSNPCGNVYAREVLDALADIAVENDLIVISDEIYDQLLYDGLTHESALTARPEMKDRTIYVNGASKTYAMTGWRIGWTLAPKDVTDAMASIQDHATSNPASFAVAGAYTALTGPQECVEEMRRAFEERRTYMYDRLAAMSCCRISRPRGAFYAMPDFAPVMGRDFGGQVLSDSMDLAGYLLDKAAVALVPGTPFGAPTYARLSFATSMETITKGLDRIEEALC